MRPYVLTAYMVFAFTAERIELYLLLNLKCAKFYIDRILTVRIYKIYTIQMLANILIAKNFLLINDYLQKF